MGRQMLLYSRVLVDQCHLATASSRKAAATLAAVGLTHKETTSSMLVSKAYRWQPSNCSRATGGCQLVFGYQNSAAKQHWPYHKNSIYYHTSLLITLLCGGSWGRVLTPSLLYPTSSQQHSGLGLLLLRCPYSPAAKH